MSKSLGLARKNYKRDYDMKVRNTATFNLGQMVHMGKPLLVASFVGNAERLEATTYNNLLPKIIELFVIASVQPNTLIIDEHGIHNTMLIDRATIAPDNKHSTNISQHLSFAKNLRWNMRESCKIHSWNPPNTPSTGSS